MTVDPGASRQPKKLRALTGPQTFTLLFEDDGWPTIQDGQNAACLKALFHLVRN